MQGALPGQSAQYGERRRTELDGVCGGALHFQQMGTEEAQCGKGKAAAEGEGSTDEPRPPDENQAIAQHSFHGSSLLIFSHFQGTIPGSTYSSSNHVPVIRKKGCAPLVKARTN